MAALAAGRCSDGLAPHPSSRARGIGWPIPALDRARDGRDQGDHRDLRRSRCQRSQSSSLARAASCRPMRTCSSAKRWRGTRPSGRLRLSRRQIRRRAAAALRHSPKAGRSRSSCAALRMAQWSTRKWMFVASAMGSTPATHGRKSSDCSAKRLCVISNTGDRGFELDPSDDGEAAAPRSFPAKLAKLLLARHRAGAPPLTLMPCELIPMNGTALREAVTQALDRWRAPSPARQWIVEECIWANSARRPHRFRAARTRRRDRRALRPVGDRRASRADHAVPARRRGGYARPAPRICD